MLARHLRFGFFCRQAHDVERPLVTLDVRLADRQELDYLAAVSAAAESSEVHLGRSVLS
jgi:hypothetical protein